MGGRGVGQHGAYHLPDAVEGVNFWRQNDPPGSKAESAADRVVENALRQDKRVRLCRPPAGFKDVNDWLQAAAAPAQGLVAGGAV